MREPPDRGANQLYADPVGHALRVAFKQTDMEILSRAEADGSNGQRSQGGSTALVVLRIGHVRSPFDKLPGAFQHSICGMQAVFLAVVVHVVLKVCRFHGRLASFSPKQPSRANLSDACSLRSSGLPGSLWGCDNSSRGCFDCDHIWVGYAAFLERRPTAHTWGQLAHCGILNTHLPSCGRDSSCRILLCHREVHYFRPLDSHFRKNICLAGSKRDICLL